MTQMRLICVSTEVRRAGWGEPPYHLLTRSLSRGSHVPLAQTYALAVRTTPYAFRCTTSSTE